MPEKFAFIDTSIFLHYRPFDDVDWLLVLGVDSVALVLAPITISELNDKKDEPGQKLRQRAASIIKKLETLWSKRAPVEVRPGVELVLQDAEPLIDYAAHQLDYRSQDDRLLASVIQFADSMPKTQVVVVSDDFGLRLKARRHGIDAVGLPGELKLPDEPDPNEKRIQQLERELLELKRATPALELTFTDGANRLEVALDPPVTRNPDDIDREKTLVRLKYKKMAHDEEEDKAAEGLGPSVARALVKWDQPSREDVVAYNAALEQFYGEYDAWLLANAYHVNRDRRTVGLELVLGNDGTAPAQDIHIFLHFPDGLTLYSDTDLPRSPAEPRPPEKPRGILSRITPRIPNSMTSLSTTLPIDFGPRNVSSPSIRRTNSYEVTIHVQQLKHGMIQPLNHLYAVFDSYDAAQSFGIEYHLVAANIPKPTKGNLHVIIRQPTE